MATSLSPLTRSVQSVRPNGVRQPPGGIVTSLTATTSDRSRIVRVARPLPHREGADAPDAQPRCFSDLDPDDGTLGVFVRSRARIASGILQDPRIGALIPNLAEPLRWNTVFR